MTRGAQVDGPWDGDAVAALPGDRVAHIAQAPQLHPPGDHFAYDNAGVQLLSAAASAILGETLATFADRELFAPLGIDTASWASEPGGDTRAAEGLSISAADLAKIGQLWLDQGVSNGSRLLSADFFAQMTTPHSAGGPPESEPYGYLTWLPRGMLLAGGWAGQHMMVVPAADAVAVITGDPGFDPGPPPTDRLPPDWQPALHLLREDLLPTLLRATWS